MMAGKMSYVCIIGCNATKMPMDKHDQQTMGLIPSPSTTSKLVHTSMMI